MFIQLLLLFVFVSWSIDHCSCYHRDQPRIRGQTRLGSDYMTSVYDSENGGDYDRQYDDYRRDRYYTPSRGQYKSRREGSVYDSSDRSEFRRGYPYPDKEFTGIVSDEFQERKRSSRLDPKKEITSIGHPISLIQDKMTRNQLGKRLSTPNCGNAFPLMNLIIGGEDAIERAYPWIVSILQDGQHWCGGSIIAARWILSAAHCFVGDEFDGVTWSIRVGTIDKNQGRTYKIKKVIPHEKYNVEDVSEGKDIALLMTTKPIVFTKYVQPICLPDNSLDNVRMSKVVVAGWGDTTGKGNNADFLQKAILTVTRGQECAEKYRKIKKTIYASQFCTWDRNKDACQGDSGGPAIEIVNRKATLVGIVSYGKGCADFPGVYTKVSYFLRWISFNMKGTPNYKPKSYPNIY